MVHGLLLPTVKTPFVQVCMTRALTSSETICDKIETRLSDSTISYNSVADHRSQRPVLFPLHSYVNRCHVCLRPHWVSRSKPKKCMLRYQHAWANLDGSRCFEACCWLPLCEVKKGAPQWGALVAKKLTNNITAVSKRHFYKLQHLPKTNSKTAVLYIHHFMQNYMLFALKIYSYFRQ